MSADTRFDAMFIARARELAELNDARLAVSSQHGLTVDQARIVFDAIERRRSEVKTDIRQAAKLVLERERSVERPAYCTCARATTEPPSAICKVCGGMER